MNARAAQLAPSSDLVLEELPQGLHELRPIFSGRPPTLWCDLIVTEGRREATDSITSG
jgi:hypothetical protein